MPKVLALDHVGIHVADVEQSLTFYRDALGLPLMERPEMGFPGAWLRVDARQSIHLIGRNAHPALPPVERHFSLEVDDAPAFAQRLIGLGFEPGPARPRADGAVQVFVRDPDGHVVELLSYLRTRAMSPRMRPAPSPSRMP